MPRQVESGIARRFGSRSANPRAVRAYSSDAGWVELPEPKLLTYAVAHELRQAGYTMVEARWRRHVRQLTLSSLVPRRHSHHSSDAGAPDAAASEPLQSAAHPASTGSSKNAETSRNPGSSRNAGSAKGTRRPPRRRRRGRAIAWWITACVVAVLIACTGWIAVRALMAKSQLEASVSLVSTIKTDVAKGDVSAARTSSAELSKKAESARSLTSDPIWRAAEVIPWVGGNLTAVRQVSDVVANVADDSITPLAATAGSINLNAFKPVNGAIQLEPLIKAQPTLSRANTAMQTQLTRAEAIDTSGTLGFVSKAVTQLTASLRSAGQITDAVSRASALLPSMLGHDGPRNYLLLFQNNAELRSTGGIPGALALVHVENGAISLAQQASTRDFPKYPSPVLPLSAETTALYQPNVGEYIQDVTATPQFPVAAQLAREMWKRQYGTEVDGVITLDPVALSYLLKATGPVTLATGDRLTSANAVKLLLSETYQRYSDPAMQDAFFASAAAEVFAKVAGGSFKPTTMIMQLAKAGGEHRILIWSANTAEQTSLAKTTLAGELPVSSASQQQFGVYFNDNTAAKMDYYLHTTIGLGQAVCRADKRPTYAVSVTLSSSAPSDAATSLPRYVTGGGASGVAAGTVQTIVAVYAPKGATLVGATSGGKQYGVNWASLGGHPVGTAVIALAPGQKTTVEFQFVGTATDAIANVASTTPQVNVTETHGLDFDCESAIK